MHSTRLIELDDAAELAALRRANRQFLAPWEPSRAEIFFTTGGQQAVIVDALAKFEQGSSVPHVILEDGMIAGQITLSGIVRGPLQSCSMGYWVAAAQNGRGLATSAVRRLIGLAFGELGLHRIQAETLLHNVASQRVLERNGFARIGMAPQYLKIDGRWQDHILFQLVNHPIINQNG